MRVYEFINFEAAYTGNIGAMEMMKFYQIATPEQKLLLKTLIAKGKKSEAWELVQQLAGIKLQGKEFSKD